MVLVFQIDPSNGRYFDIHTYNREKKQQIERRFLLLNKYYVSHLFPLIITEYLQLE